MPGHRQVLPDQLRMEQYRLQQPRSPLTVTFRSDEGQDRGVGVTPPTAVDGHLLDRELLEVQKERCERFVGVGEDGVAERVIVDELGDGRLVVVPLVGAVPREVRVIAITWGISL